MLEHFGDLGGMGDGLTDGRGAGGTEIGGFDPRPGFGTAEFGLAGAFGRGLTLRLALGLSFGRRFRRGGRFRRSFRIAFGIALRVAFGVALADVFGQGLGRRRRDFLREGGSGRFIEMRLAEVAGGIRLRFSESRMNGGFFGGLGRGRKLLGRRFGGRFGFVHNRARPAGATTAAATTAATSPRAATRSARRGG
jgi:hypothetical protein